VLSLTIFGSQFTSGVGGEQLARIEPVLRRRASEDRHQFPVELGDGGTAMMPERCAVGHVLESYDLFDASVAVRGHDDDATGKFGCRELRQA
jgi:hypothetical protein